MSVSSIGICFGSSSISLAEIVSDGGTVRVGRTETKSHESNPRKAFSELIETIDLNAYAFGMFTGRKFRGLVNAESITEPESMEYALRFLRETGGYAAQAPGAVASLGSENFIVYALDGDGMISGVETGNKCASGTGEFFLQQIRRMNVSVRRRSNSPRSRRSSRYRGGAQFFARATAPTRSTRTSP